MVKVNENFVKLPSSYLFTEIARRVENFCKSNTGDRVIRMGIGDVTRPLCKAAIDGLKRGVEDESHERTFHGYGPEQGYGFLREAIAANDYQMRGINVGAEEIYVSDGAKSDTGNIGDIFSTACRVAVTDPVYPVYVDTNVMSGRAGEREDDGKWNRIIYLPCTEENNFIPSLPTERPDIIYLCYPNNPTGTALNKTELAKWVDYARENGSLILFDSAYEAYISSEDVPHSIFEIEGARETAIEFRSFSKTAGFTGVRCGYTVIPRELMGVTERGDEVSLGSLWNRRQCTKFNGASYITQRGAEALYSEVGKEQVRETIGYYMTNAKLLREGLSSAGLRSYGGIDAPYIWVKTPEGLSSWDFFDLLLERCRVVGTPGAGFGPSGEGYFRLTAFSGRDDTLEAVDRISKLRI